MANAPSGLRNVLDSPGQSLDPQLQGRMETLFSRAGQGVEARTAQPTAAPIGLGAADSAEEKNADAMASTLDTPEAARATGAGTAADFSGIRVHTDAAANAAARQLGAKAFTIGPRIVFASGQFAPNTHGGDRLLAHELAHSLQQRAGPPRIARSVDEWRRGSVNLAGLTYTQALAELDELTQWLQRQTSSSADTARIEEAVTALRRRIRELDTAAAGPTPRERRARRGAPRAEAELPARYPRILTEMTSVAYTDPAQMREEYDLIVQWLARRDIPASQRRILTVERDNLAPQLSADRARVIGEHHAARVQAALTPAAQDDAHALETVARTITAISSEAGNPGVFYIYHAGERVAISAEQAGRLRTNLRTELERAARRAQGDVDYYWARYHAQVALNEDSPIIAGISGWLANVHDPADELRFLYRWSGRLERTVQAHIAAGRMVEAAATMPELDRVREQIRSLSRAFYEGYIEGAESALHGLEFTRDAAFAVAGSIAAVVAAPLVAGYIGVTGVTGTVLTIAGTGVTVGTGVGVVRGASEAGGVLIAGGSLSEAVAGFSTEFRRGFREGFVAGAAGGAGRLLGLAAGASASVSQQVLIRVGGDFVVNATSSMLDALVQSCAAGHCDVGRAVQLGLTNGLASIPGSVVGLSNSNVARYFLGPLTSGATSYVSAIHAGATPQEALRGAGVAVASNLAMSSAQHGAEADQALVARGRAARETTRATVATATRRVASAGAAVLIGVAEPVPALRSGFGGSPIASIDTPAATAARVPPAQEAPAGTTAATSSTVTAAHETPPPLPVEATAAAPAATHAQAEPVAPASSHPEVAPAAATTAQAPGVVDDLNVEQAFSPDAAYDVGEIRTTGRSEASGRSRDFASLDRVVLSRPQRLAAIRLHGQRLGAALRQAWQGTQNPRELADLQAIRNHWNAGRHEEARVLARATFDRHRGRFWRAVSRDSSLRAIFTDAGMVFPPGGARPPVYVDPTTGEQLDFMSIEHQTRLADDPTLALDPGNLSMVLGDENSVTLEWIRRHAQP